MPTVPPTFISLDDPHDIVASIGVISDAGDISSSPTPDPDTDDGVLVPVVTGDGVGAVTSSSSLSLDEQVHREGFKHRLCLSDLTLHSPSSIVGTPFDVSPRFEYPFPPSDSSSEIDISSSPAFHAMTQTYMPYPPGSFGAHSHYYSPPMPSSRSERSYSPTRPKRLLRDPPIPPSLAKKRLSIGFSVSHKRSRSASTAVLSENTSDASEVVRQSHAQKERRSFSGNDAVVDADPVVAGQVSEANQPQVQALQTAPVPQPKSILSDSVAKPSLHENTESHEAQHISSHVPDDPPSGLTFATPVR